MAGFGHVRKLKDVTEVKLSPLSSTRTKGGGTEKKTEGEAEDMTEARYGCPVLGVPLNGRFPFVAILDKGVVVSEKAIKTSPQAVEELIGCSLAEVRGERSVSIFPQEEVGNERRATLMERMREEAKVKIGKKAKKKRPPVVAMAPAPPPEMKKKARLEHEKDKVVEGSEVYRSIFTSSRKGEEVKETFCARSNSARGCGLT